MLTSDAPPAPRRRLRRARPRDADPGSEPDPLPVSTLTVIRPEPFGAPDAAHRWLASVRESDDQIAAELDGALLVVNQAIHAQRTSTLDPHLADVSAHRALVVRIGFGTGDELADGRYAEAIEVPHATRRRRLEALRPQERMAAILGRREEPSPAEELLLRARGDIDAGRDREAALQLRVGLEALLAEPRDGNTQAERADLEALDDRRAITGEAANEALRGELSGDRVAELKETLRLCERVLRRRRLA